MSKVPVLIVTLCRYEHFFRCIESLKKNIGADETEVYIGLDYPAKEGHWDGYKKICEYLDNGVEGFKEVHVIRQPYNLGAGRNHRVTREKLYEKFDRYVFSEDDNEFSVNFLEYMNKCMDFYENDPEVVAVSGYMYPVDTDSFTGNTIALNTYFSAFGRGIWRERDEKTVDGISMESFTKMYRNIHKMHVLRKTSVNQYCNFVKGMVEYIPELVKNQEIQPIDLSYGLYMFFHNKYMIFPVISKVRNWGYDGSGANCEKQSEKIKSGECYREYNFSLQPLDCQPEFAEPKIEQNISKQELNKRVSDFFRIPKKEEWTTVIVYYVSLLIGCKNMAAVIKSLKRDKPKGE